MTDKQIFQTAVNEYKAVDVEGVGRLRWVRENSDSPNGKGQGVKCYLWVYNSTGSALTVGASYYHGTAGYALTSGINPTTFLEEIFTFGQSSKGTFINLLAGVAVSAIPSGQYGWVQVYGYNSTIQVEGTVAIAAGDYLKGVSGQVYLIKDASGGTAPTAGRRGVIALAAKGTAGTANIAGFIDCL
jgi:hypothetical protein